MTENSERVANVASAVRRVRERIAAAGGDPGAVTLVAVTKGHPIEVVRAALATGVIDLGENYAQELVAKDDALGERPGAAQARWHAIGRLQRNKVRVLAGRVRLWQSLDRPALAAEIARRDPGAAVLVQVDPAPEPGRGGCRPELVPALVQEASDLGLDVRGLMALGPAGSPERAADAFVAVARLADRLGLAERSMGMSADLEAAVAAGSTMVRVGSALFGPRSGGKDVG